MTASELIKLLKQFPEDTQVVVQSYEDGFDPVTDCKNITIKKSNTKEWYFGIYDESKQGEQAILISSKYNRSDKEERDEK